MPRFQRTDRLNERLREEIAQLVGNEIRDPRVGLVTITAVETSPELDHAKVYFTVLGDEEEKEAALAGLRSAAGFVRTQLGRRMHIRRVPEIHFHLDRKLAEAIRIESLLRDVAVERGDRDLGEDGEPGEGGAGAGAEAGPAGDVDAAARRGGADQDAEAQGDGDPETSLPGGSATPAGADASAADRAAGGADAAGEGRDGGAADEERGRRDGENESR